jgi:tetratricopeptide (TPR) repeat protein
VAYAAARRLAPSPQVLSDWHRAAATDDEAAGRKEAALWDLDRAVACLKAGDPSGYRAVCAEMAKRLPKGDPKMSHHESNSAARAATLGPNATDDWTRALAWTDHALARLAEIEKARPALKELIRREQHRFLSARGAVLYRAGRFEEAVKVLREAMNLHPDVNEFNDWLFLALAEHRLGHTEAAKEAAVKARAAERRAKAGPVWNVAEVELLDAELNAALPLPR